MSNNSVFGFNGVNTATLVPSGYYGAFQDDTNQSAVSANTAYEVKFNTTELSNGVQIVNDGSGNPTKITLANTGIYNIQFSLQLEKISGSGNYIIDIWLRKNGIDIDGTTGKVVLTGTVNASPIVASWNYVLNLVANDYVQLMWATNNVNAVILASLATPPHPSIPSSILTVTQQSGIMAGTGITALNSLTDSAQDLVVGTSGSDFTITSSGTTHTFDLPTADATNRGALDSSDWITFNDKASYTPRVQSVTSSANVTPTNLNDIVTITAQAVGLTLVNPSGSWDQGQSLIIRIKDNGGAQTIAYDTNYRAIGVTLPTTTTAGKTTYLGIIYNSTDTKWDVIGVTTQA
jgi:hypothetical protein